MARPKKIGLDFFPLNCQMNDKIDMLEAEHGIEGFALYIKLLQEIYQTENGELDMSIVFRWKTLGKKYGIPEENLRNITRTMMEIGLLDKTAFEQRQVFTSNGVKRVREEVSFRREKDRMRKQEADSEFSTGFPVENATKEKKKKRKDLSVADAALGFSTTENEEKNYTLTHQIRLVIAEKIPEYHWSAKDGTHAKQLGEKLKASVKSRQSRDPGAGEPTDGECIAVLKRMMAESTKLPDYYRFRDIPTFNEKFNQIVVQLKDKFSPATNGQPIQRSMHEIK